MLDGRFHRRARACPSPCIGCIKAAADGFGLTERSQGTGPRATMLFGLTERSRGTDPRRFQIPSAHRRARACPSPCIGCIKPAADGFGLTERSRGTGPRATVLFGSPERSRGTGPCATMLFGSPERSRGTGPRTTKKKFKPLLYSARIIRQVSSSFAKTNVNFPDVCSTCPFAFGVRCKV